MPAEPDSASRPWRWLAQLVVAVCGIVAIVGSGGGSAPDCSLFSSACNPAIGPVLPFASAGITPFRSAVQVGSDVTFTVSTNLGSPTYSWCRAPAGSTSCTSIAGVTGSSYQITGANLADDGTTIRVTVTGTGTLNGTAFAYASLAVSAQPPVSYADGDFADLDWDVSAVVDPATNGPTFDASRAAAGGNPDAFRSVSYDLPIAPASVHVFHAARSAVYDPATQGAIYLIDFTEDCIRTSTNYLPFTLPMFEQGGRRYIASIDLAARGCGTAWQAVSLRRSLAAQDFVPFDGPACGAGESCPDFSATGGPIRLGLVTVAALSSGLPPGTVAHFAHGFDNWRVSVWRH